jgi:hypothetical protein
MKRATTIVVSSTTPSNADVATIAISAIDEVVFPFCNEWYKSVDREEQSCL